jgi:16S rRNA (adenine1518-N6/adenine1519-N6)-dimethyltransferase
MKSEFLDIIHGDILKFDETVLRHYDLPYRVVANIPYYITGAILEKFLSSSYQPTSMTLVMQKEVVDRIMARDGKESILSLSVKAYGIPTYHGKIPARYFSPEPKVDSAILKIDDISKSNFKGTEEEILFFKIVKTGFAHKRKKLISNLADIIPKHSLEKIFADMKWDTNIRAERISLDGWLLLVKNIQDSDILSA